MSQHVYTGPAPRGLVTILGRQVPFVRGEAVEFSTLTPHWFGTIDGPVELIAVFGAHGERTHFH